MALLAALYGYRPIVEGFSNRTLRPRVGALLDPEHPEAYTRSRMTYDLRRLRRKGLIVRLPHSHRYELTPLGRRVTLFFSRTQARLFEPAFASFNAADPDQLKPLQRAWRQLDRAIESLIDHARLAA